MEKIRKWMSKNNLKYVVLFNGEKPNSNVFYLSNYSGYGFFVIPLEDEPFLYVPEMESEKAKKTGMKVVIANKKLLEFLEEGNIGLDFESLTHKDFESFSKSKRRLVDVSELMRKLRIIKKEEEISKIKKVCEITDEILEKLFSNWNFKHEGEVVAFLFKETKLRGCEFAFDPIVASGKNASVPHHLESKELEKGFCVIDFGVKYMGYCSDSTRTIYLGEPSGEERKLYDKILKVQKEAIDSAKEGVEFMELHELVKKELGDKFIHALGHGVGIDVHEMPFVSKKDKIPFEEGMVIAIEPGYYEEGRIGIRIEDTLVIRKDGPEVLTKLSKELISINN